MNSKQLSILIVLLVLIGGLGLYLYKRNTASWRSTERVAEQKLLGDFPLNDVAHITVKHTNSELNLVKQDDQWKVRERYNYPANFQEISECLRKMWELKAVQTQPVGPSQLGRLELMPPDKGTNSGTLVEFKDKNDKLIRSVLLGKKHMRQSASPSPFGGDSGGWADGRFVLVQGDKPAGEVEVSVVSESFSNVEPKPDSWINKDFFKVEKLRSISVTTTNATNGFTLAREVEGGEMKLADKKPNEELDTTKVSSLGSALSYPNFNDVVSPEAKPETLGFDKPVKATLETFDHFVYSVQIGKSTNDDTYPLKFSVTADLPKERTPGKDEKAEDKTKLDKEFKEKNDKLKEKLNQEKALEKWTYLVSKWTVDPLLKTRLELIAPPKKEEEKKDQAQQNTAAKIDGAKPDQDNLLDSLSTNILTPPSPLVAPPPANPITQTNGVPPTPAVVLPPTEKIMSQSPTNMPPPKPAEAAPATAPK
jgi:hypothetical protein